MSDKTLKFTKMQKAGEIVSPKISHNCHGLVSFESGSVSYTSYVTSSLGDLVTCLASLLDLDQILALTLSSCVILRQLLKIFEPSLPHLYIST